jgi:hypothetical protein
MNSRLGAFVFHAHRLTRIAPRGATRDRGNQSIAAPKLNIVAINQALGLSYGFLIAVVKQRFESDEMPVDPNGKGPILCIPKVS